MSVICIVKTKSSSRSDTIQAIKIRKKMPDKNLKSSKDYLSGLQREFCGMWHVFKNFVTTNFTIYPDFINFINFTDFTDSIFMKKEYNARQRKIYEEYNLYSIEILIRMLADRNKYKPEVIGIIKDIIAEHNPGFYSQEPEESGIQPDNNIEETGSEDIDQTTYEEVPWLNKNPLYFPGISGSIGEFVNISVNEADDEAETEKEDEPEIDIEAEKQKYWKCPKCNELVEMEYDVCWNCQAEMPRTIEHPNEGEVVKEIIENSGRVNTFGIGLGLIGLGGLILLFDRSRYYHFDDFIHNDIFRYFFSALFGILGLYFIIIHFTKKSDKNE